MKRFARRDVLRGSVAIAASGAFASVTSAAPPPSPVTPEMIAAAKKEGRVVYYTSIDLPVAERIAKAFEARYPGIDVRVERTGAERVFQRIGQEYASRIHSVDVVNSSDAAHFVVWKREGMLEAYVPEDVAKYYPAEHKDLDGTFASFRVSAFHSVIPCDSSFPENCRHAGLYANTNFSCQELSGKLVFNPLLFTSRRGWPFFVRDELDRATKSIC